MTRSVQHSDSWQQRSHKALAETYREQRRILLDMVVSGLEAQMWLCSIADAGVSAASCASTIPHYHEL